VPAVALTSVQIKLEIWSKPLFVIKKQVKETLDAIVIVLLADKIKA
jgi:hypothetical protein